MDLSLQLMPFQAKGVDLLSNNPRQMLAWAPGVGKTPTAVRACARVKAKRILVFCPLIATSVWRQHFLDWSGYSDIRVLDVESIQKPYGFIEGEGVRIIPYSRASQESSKILQVAARFSDQWDVVILDECHYLKNADANRTKAVYGNAIDLKNSPLEHAKHVWCLTGTPLLNGPHELWTHLHALMPSLIQFPNLGTMSYRAFVQRYCHVRHTNYGFHVVGAKNTAELASRIKGFADRKRTEDVLLDLPPLRIATYELPASVITVTKELEDALSDMRLEGIEGYDDDELLAVAQSPGSVGFSTARRLVGMAKAPGVVALVDNILESGSDKVIVFAHHRDVIAELQRGLLRWNPRIIQGGTPQKERDSAIQWFQNSPAHAPVIILSIEAAGEAITLNAASQVVIAEPSPVPAKNAQAIARAHRKGQRNPVLAQFVTLPGSFDAHFMSLIARKTKDIMKVVDPELVPASPQLTFPDFPDLEEMKI